jgi:hypothetical protein
MHVQSDPIQTTSSGPADEETTSNATGGEARQPAGPEPRAESTRKRVWSFDDECLRLARFFLSDYKVTEEKENELAQAIQDRIENFLTDLDDDARIME